MNAEQFANLRRESWRTDWDGELYEDKWIFSQKELESIENGTDTDWIDLMFNDGYKTNHSINVNGGDEKTQFNMSFGY